MCNSPPGVINDKRCTCVLQCVSIKYVTMCSTYGFANTSRNRKMLNILQELSTGPIQLPVELWHTNTHQHEQNTVAEIQQEAATQADSLNQWDLYTNVDSVIPH